MLLTVTFDNVGGTRSDFRQATKASIKSAVRNLYMIDKFCANIQIIATKLQKNFCYNTNPLLFLP